jgi:hypothetical protein
MTEAEMQTAVVIIRQGGAHRVPIHAIEGRIRGALPAITDDDLEAAFERASDELVAEADEIEQFTKGRRER